MANERGLLFLLQALDGHPAFRNDGEKLAFAWLVATASEKDGYVRYKGRLAMLSRGQTVVSVRDFGERMGRDRNWAHRFLKRLAEHRLIRFGETASETQGETAVNFITICNYNAFHPYEAGGETASETAGETPRREDVVIEPASRVRVKETNSPTLFSTSETPSDLEKREREKKNPMGSKKRETEKDNPTLGSRLPKDWSLPADWGEWACRQMGWSPAVVHDEAAIFRDYWVARTGALARKADWFATWRNWCRNSRRGKSVGNGQRPLSL